MYLFQLLRNGNVPVSQEYQLTYQNTIKVSIPTLAFEFDLLILLTFVLILQVYIEDQLAWKNHHVKKNGITHILINKEKYNVRELSVSEHMYTNIIISHYTTKKNLKMNYIII